MFVYRISGCGFDSRYRTSTSDIAPVLSKKFLDIQATIECRFTLKHVSNMIIAYSQMKLELKKRLPVSSDDGNDDELTILGKNHVISCHRFKP